MELDRWASKPSFRHGTVRIGQMGSKKLPLGLDHMGRERGREKKASIEASIRCGKLAESLPTYHLTAETRAQIPLQKTLDYDLTAANTCLVFNIVTTHRCAGGEFVQQRSASMFFNKCF